MKVVDRKNQASPVRWLCADYHKNRQTFTSQQLLQNPFILVTNSRWTAYAIASDFQLFVRWNRAALLSSDTAGNKRTTKADWIESFRTADYQLIPSRLETSGSLVRIHHTSSYKTVFVISVSLIGRTFFLMWTASEMIVFFSSVDIDKGDRCGLHLDLVCGVGMGSFNSGVSMNW